MCQSGAIDEEIEQEHNSFDIIAHFMEGDSTPLHEKGEQKPARYANYRRGGTYY